MSNFVREERYLVIKTADLRAALTPDEIQVLRTLRAKVNVNRMVEGRTTDRKYVVVSDSNRELYEATWKAIEASAS